MYPAQCLLAHTLCECGASHTGVGGRQVRHQEFTVIVTKRRERWTMAKAGRKASGLGQVWKGAGEAK